MDLTARFIAQRLTEALEKNVIVDNRPGSGSAVGTGVVANSAPDGHTLLVSHNAMAIIPTLYPKLPYDTLRDFAHVALIGSTTNTLVIYPGLPVRTVKELISLAKAKPGVLNFSSTGAGGTSTLAMDYFKLFTGTEIVNVPFNGTTPALTAVMGGQTQLMISAWPGTIPHVNAKRLIALATTGAKRSEFLPDLPTLNEADVPGYEFDTWYGIHVPVKTPKEIVYKLNTTVVKALGRSELKQQLEKLGIEAGGLTPEAFDKFVRAEAEKMGKIIKASGARPE